MNRLQTWRDHSFRPGEIQLLVWSTAWFFCLLGGYYQLRPLREAEAFARGSDEIPWLFLASFLAMLVASPIYASVANRGLGMRLVSRVYRFFELNLLVFFFAMQANDPNVAAWVGRFYFVWLSVFNLFVVSRTLYQAKGFLDTAVVRGGDVMSAQLFGLLRFSGLSLTAIAAGFLPLAVLTGWLGMRTGRQQGKMQQLGRPAGHD